MAILAILLMIEILPDVRHKNSWILGIIVESYILGDGNNIINSSLDLDYCHQHYATIEAFRPSTTGETCWWLRLLGFMYSGKICKRSLEGYPLLTLGSMYVPFIREGGVFVCSFRNLFKDSGTLGFSTPQTHEDFMMEPSCAHLFSTCVAATCLTSMTMVEVMDSRFAPLSLQRWVLDPK